MLVHKHMVQLLIIAQCGALKTCCIRCATAGSHSLDKSTQEGASNSAVNQQSAVTSWLQTAQGAGHGGADQQGPRRMGGPACLGGMGNNPYPASCCAFSFRVILIQSCPTCTSVIADTDP